jgi:hypothetical protein
MRWGGGGGSADVKASIDPLFTALCPLLLCNSQRIATGKLLMKEKKTFFFM